MKKVFTSLTLACLLVLALCTWAQASDAPLALRVTVNGQTMGSSGLLLDPEESRTALASPMTTTGPWPGGLRTPTSSP